MTEENAANYTHGKYRTPDGAPADIVIFTITAEHTNRTTKSLPKRELEVLLIKRKLWPCKGMWALPGGFSNDTESMYETARRELEEETGVKDVHMEYFNVYSKPGRDPRGWILSHAFFALVHEDYLAERKAADDAADVGLFSVNELGRPGLELAFDHLQIIQDAMEQIRSKMLLTSIAKEFLPDEFTLSELYQVIQTVVPDFEEANFIRKMKSTQSRSGVLEPVLDTKGEPKKSNEYSQRAAQLYRFTGSMPRLSLYS
ncbi:ADP-ribose pyrophosphatase YjhB, NUDIX family [Paenibacillus sp. 1_12]|uniref:NUDIX domain-containing protein n=1 Tax=Paenibacillus sp. 1_12 TaxID=1566278 RepID=UPI0008ED9C27|nr:NUDIX domain-containing protein [Paenibacillus sp. 1_12]SFL10458.1 ADP-ribose pyrophosphatase YjhB, NUDIX family [Paenibacillus sp. 1_12]